MHLSNLCYYYIKASLNISLIVLLKSLLILMRAGSLYPMLADLAPHMPRLLSDMMIDKYHCHVGKHFILALVPVIVSHLVSIKEDDLGVFY